MTEFSEDIEVELVKSELLDVTEVVAEFQFEPFVEPVGVVENVQILGLRAQSGKSCYGIRRLHPDDRLGHYFHFLVVHDGDCMDRPTKGWTGQ